MNISRFLDIKGHVYGHLKVLKKDRQDKWNRWMWLCECVCGKEVVVGSNHLRSGNTKSCGCMRYVRDDRIEDISGNKYGKLTALYLDPNRSATRKIKWVCECECGNITSVLKSHLVTGHTLSCGVKGAHVKAARRRRYFWAKDVKEKFKYMCQKCGAAGDDSSLHAHHILSFTAHKDTQFDINNGACLCETCHKDFHNKYGNMRNTEKDFCDWLYNDHLTKKAED